ncbi:MAG: radical SAM protein [Candidatus Omnitrophica bacterium]|nr:radical SAM protein [Candidatus Omnitrophota bacterium]
MIEHYRLPGELRGYYLSGALKVVDSGSLGEGFIPHKMSRELFEALGDPELKAIISKGQANLFTLTSRNTVKVPVICLLLSKSRTSSKLTGIKLKKGKFWPVMIVVPSGESILSKIGKYDFSGTMKRFGRTDPEAEGGHAMTALDAKRWGFVIVSVFSGLTMLTVLASSILSVLSGNIWWSAAGMLVSTVSVMFSIGGFRYYSLSMDIFEAFRKYIFQGRDPGEPLSHEEQMTLKAAWETPIAYRESNDIIKYHPAFRNLLSRSVVFGREALRPETAQELVRLHESYRSHTVGMLAIFPVVGYIGRRLYAATFGRGEDRQYFIHSDFSNLDELINRQIEANRKTGFYKISEEEDLPGEGVFAEKNIALPSNGLELVKTEINVDHDKLNTMRKVMKDIGEECSFCRAVESPFLKEAPRSRMEDWAFSVEATPIFSKHIIAISADHVDQGAASPDVYYDAFRMMANLLSGPNGGLWQASWPGRLGTTMPGHMHFSLFQRKTPPPVDSFEKEPICVDRQGHGVVYLVENYPDKENAVTAFLIKGRPDGPETNIFAKRCADLENIIRNSGYDVDKYLTRDEAGAINVFFYPRVGEVTTQKQKFYERKLGPLEMSGIWPEIKRSVMTGDEEGMSQQAIKEIMFALSQGSLTRYSPACLDLMEAIKRHFYESEGVGLFPPSMDLLVTDRCNLNCPICWGSNMPEFKARSVNEQKKMIDVMYENGMRRMIFTGGEPLLEEHLAELLKYAKDKGVTTWLFTNGILMDDARADEIMPFVDMISLSLDGHDDATNALNRRKGHFDAVMRVLDIMVRKFPHKDVQVLTVVTNRNKGDVRKIGALLRGKSRGLERFQWKLNYYKRIGRSHEEMASDKDVYLMSYGEFKELAVTTLREFSDMRVRYSPPEHDMAYLFVFPDGTLATTVNAQYIKFGNVLDPGTLVNEANIKAFRQITDNIRQRAVYIPQKGAYAVPDFKKMNLMGKNGEAIIHRLHGMMLDDVSEHMRRVTRISMLIAERMNESGKAKIKQDSMALLRTAAMIHDVGSIEKHDKRLKSALSRIEKGIHAPGKPRIEMSGLSIAGWANEIAWRDASIPKQELSAAMEASRNLNDHYPLYRLYIKYTALGMPPEEDLSPEEEVVARNLYSHGKRSVDMLREKGIEIPDAVKLLVSYHHDYNGLEDKLDLMLFEQRITREEADILRLLEAILITADVFENGNNYYRRTKKSPGGKVESFDVTLDPVNGFMWKRYNETESIPDTRPLEALKELIAGYSKRNTRGVPVMDPELLDVIAEARKVPAGVDPLTAADRRMQTRVFLEVLSGVKGEGAEHVGVKRAEVLPVAVGIPASLYRSLPQESLDDLKSMSGVVSVIPISDSPDKEKMIDELNRRTRKLSAINLLIDADAVPPGAGGKVGGQEIFLVVRDFIGKARETMPEVLDTTGASPRGSEEYGSAVGLEGRGIMDVRIRLLPEYRSYRINEKSLRQMRIESAYRQHDLDRPEYAGLADDDRRSVWHIVPYNTGAKQKYLFHYADGSQLESGRCPAIMPVGLEIEKRRHVQKVSRGTDMIMDVLFISVPRDDMTPEERLEFKETVMDMWMLEGVVDEDKVILVERTNVGDEGRGISTQFFRDTLELSLGRIDPKDCVARSLAGDIDAGTDEMTTLVLSSDAGNNFGQYEVMTNLLMDEFLRVQYLNRAILMNREDEKSVFIYIPRSGQVDLEDEIRHYYDMYEKQVLIKA